MEQQLKDILSKLDSIVWLLANNSEWWETIAAALIGVVVGALLPMWLNNIGKVKIIISKAVALYLKGDGQVPIMFAGTISEPGVKGMQLMLDMDFMNTALNRKCLSSIHVEIVNKKNTLRVWLYNGEGSGFEVIKLLNINGKTIESKKCNIVISDEIINAVGINPKMFIVYSSESGKRIKCKLEKLSNFFQTYQKINSNEKKST